MAENNVIVAEPKVANDKYEVVHQKSELFYPEYERKSDLKHQTHYCPGCGHGVAHKLIAEALEDLNLQDQTILVEKLDVGRICLRISTAGHYSISKLRGVLLTPHRSKGLAQGCRGWGLR